jgi:dihydrofolate reductase
MRIALVVAVAENGVIGQDGKLPWRLKGDMRFFRQITMGKPIVMGRKTFESLPGVLDGRDNIVISRQAGFEVAGGFVVASLDEALVLARRKAAKRGVDEICVIGGAQIYEQVLPRAGRIYLTRVHAMPQGDAFFPGLGQGEWREISRAFYPGGAGNSADYSIIVLDRA